MANLVAKQVNFHSSIMSADSYKRLYNTVGGCKTPSRTCRFDTIWKLDILYQTEPDKIILDQSGAYKALIQCVNINKS